MIPLEDLIDKFLRGRFSEIFLFDADLHSPLEKTIVHFVKTLISDQNKGVQLSYSKTMEDTVAQTFMETLETDNSETQLNTIHKLRKTVAVDSNLYTLVHFIDTFSSIKQGRLQKIDEIPQDFSKDIRALLKFFMIQRLIDEQNIDKPPEFITNQLEEDLDPVVKIKYLNLLYSLTREDVKEKVKILEYLLTCISQLKLTSWEHSIQNNLAYFKQQLGRYEEALLHVNRAIELKKVSKDDLLVSRALYLKGVILQNMGQLDDAVQNLLEALELAKKGPPELRGKIHHMLGYIAENKGEYENALAHLNTAKELLSSNKKLLLQIQFSYSAILMLLGRFVEADQIYDKLYHDPDAKKILAPKLFLSMAEFYLTKGEALKAQSLLMETGENSFETPLHQAQRFTLLGGISNLLGMENKSLEYYKSAEIIYERLGNVFLLIETWFRQFLIHLQLGDQKEMNDFANKILEEEVQGSIYMSKLKNLAQAMVMKQRKRLKFLFEAENLLRRVLGEDIPFFIHILSVLNLVEILIIDYENSEEEEVFEEILAFLSNLADIGRKMNLPTIIIDTKILLSRLEIVRGKISDAFQMLEEAEEISIQHRLESYRTKVQREVEEAKTTVEQIERIFLEQNLTERLEKTKVKDYISFVATTASTLPQHFLA